MNKRPPILTEREKHERKLYVLIRGTMKDRKISQKKLEKMTGIEQSRISRILSRKLDMTVPELREIARALGITAEELSKVL